MSRRTLSLLALAITASAAQCPADAALRPLRTTCPLPIDDASPDAELLRPLKCLRGEDVHCIYSAPSFRGGLGIATGSMSAANLVGMGSLDGPQHEVEPEGGLAYEVRDLPGRGKGVVAVRGVEKGEVFMVDSPAVMVEGALMAGMNGASRRGLLQGVVRGLGEGAKERVLGLARSGGGDELLDLFVTNGCGVEAWGVAYTGLFPEVARMNHDCQPNAYFRFSARTMTMEVLAYRDISSGEEITINYAFLGMPHKERQHHLLTTWSFTCTCPLCASPTAQITASDARRREVARLRRVLSDAVEEGRHEDVVRVAGASVRLCEEEGLGALVPGFWAGLARGFLGMGELDEAGVWAERAVEGWRAFRGADSAAVEEGEELVRVIERESEKAIK